VIDALGLPDDLVRWVAIGTLFVFGIVLLVPPIADRLEAVISRVVPGPARWKGDGFWPGFLLGTSLGLVYAPCAGPILAGVITVSASQDFTAGKLAVAFAYAIGSGVVLYALMLGGRKLVDRMGSWRNRVQAVMGALMVLTAVAMAAELDIRFQTTIADELPAFLVNPTGDIEESDSVAEDLADVRGGGDGPIAAEADQEVEPEVVLPELGLAPEFTGTQEWFNTDGEPISIASEVEQGHVVLIDFWTYTCINCIRTLPYLTAWDEEYRDDGLTIVGVHAPEFPFEKEASNVEDAIADNGIEYPVVQDNELATWTAWGNQYWPAKYLIDADGQVRYTHFGEGSYDETEQAIRSLLAEAGDSDLGAEAKAKGERIDPALMTPETYLGSLRAEGWVEPPRDGTSSFDAPAEDSLDLNEFAFDGTWEITGEGATSVEDAAISFRFQAKNVFLVLGAEDGPQPVEVLLDGEPVSDADAGSDVKNGVAQISAERLYRLVELDDAGEHTLTLRFAPGITGYAFTFG
jgi:thiol-disulfide isomerase/thioredoxin